VDFQDTFDAHHPDLGRLARILIDWDQAVQAGGA